MLQRPPSCLHYNICSSVSPNPVHPRRILPRLEDSESRPLNMDPLRTMMARRNKRRSVVAYVVRERAGMQNENKKQIMQVVMCKTKDMSG